MAQEIRASGTLTITKNGFTITGNTSKVISMTGSNYSGAVLTISSSYTQIPTGSLGDLRYMFISNESTSSIDVTTNVDSQSFSTLQNGDLLMLPPTINQKTYWVKSTEAAADIQVVLTES